MASTTVAPGATQVGYFDVDVQKCSHSPDVCTYEQSLSVPENGTTTIALPPGDYTLTLLPNLFLLNCTAAGGPKAVTVRAEMTTDVTFNVTCARTGEISVTVPTTGTDPDFYYEVDVDGMFSANITVIPLGAGPHTITLFVVPSNCTVTGTNPVHVTVAEGATTNVVFPVSCAPNPTLRITLTTSGAHLPTGYTIGVDRNFSAFYDYSTAAPINGVASIAIHPGAHTVYLDGVPANCTVSTANPVSAVLILGAPTDVAFAVVCH